MAVLFGVLALLVPGLAMAAPVATSDEVVATTPPAPTDATPVADQPVTEPPAADQPVTAPPVTEPPAADQPVTAPPVAEPPAADQPVTAPPAADQPVTEAPAPPPSTVDPTVPPETEATPAPAPPPVATPPGTTTGTRSTLPVTPDVPRAAIVPDKVPLATLVPAHSTPVVLPPVRPKVSVDASVPDAPASVTPTAATPRHTAAPVAAKVSTAAGGALHQDLLKLDPVHARPAAATPPPTLDQPKGQPLAGEVTDPSLFAQTAVAAVGGIQSGSSLLAVLAGYVLPGVAGPPATSIIMFILVGLIVGIARAPRPQLSERLHLGGLLGARSGHGLAVCRPG